MVEPSSKEHENDRYWASRELFGLVHALVISVLSPASQEKVVLVALGHRTVPSF